MAGRARPRALPYAVDGECGRVIVAGVTIWPGRYDELQNTHTHKGDWRNTYYTVVSFIYGPW